MRKFKSQKKQYNQIREKGGGEAQEFRVRLARDNEIFGHVEELYGGKRMMVNCSDERRRICRVPGKLKRIWVKLGDYVLVEPWPLEGDKKGDIVWRYRETEVDWLKQHGYLKGL